MNIKTGNSFLRIQLVSPANFGAAGGNATLDCPTQLDACSGLPFIPNSSLKGVIKASFEAHGRQDTSLVFGTPDVNADSLGEDEKIKSLRHQSLAGQIVFGNGELLVFPFINSAGGRMWIFPMDQITKLIELENLDSDESDFGDFLRGFYSERNPVLILGYQKVVVQLECHFSDFCVDEYEGAIKVFHNYLKRWVAESIPDVEPWLIVSANIASNLWHQSADYRTLTALNDHKTVMGQSLRRIELVPENSLFISLLTWFGQSELKLDDEIHQIGSFESVGLGFSRLSLVGDSLNVQDQSPLNFMETQLDNSKTAQDEMVDCHDCILKLMQSDQPADKIRSIINNFGVRVHRESIEAALGFEFAKAKIGVIPKDKEALAHRWFVRNLLKMDENALPDSWNTFFLTPIGPMQKKQLLLRWNWLRRYGNFMLK